MTVGPRLLGRHPWVPAQKSSTVGPHDQFSLLRALGNQTKLSTFDTVAFRVRRRPDRFHARRRAPPLHSPCQKFGNTDYFFKLPNKATIIARFPLLFPIWNRCELRGLCRRSYFGPRTCDGSITIVIEVGRALNLGFPFSPLNVHFCVQSQAQR